VVEGAFGDCLTDLAVRDEMPLVHVLSLAC
jgi:hypothetical protein